MNKADSRYIVAGETLYGQLREILVKCPRCQSCAVITPRPSEKPNTLGLFTPRRVVCAACSFVKEWEGQALEFDWNGDPVRDCYFGLPLWLQAACCGHVVWAYNRRHLGIMERYVRALHREQRRDPKLGWHNNSLTNRLPEWMIIAKHRDAVLDAIAKLKDPSFGG